MQTLHRMNVLRLAAAVAAALSLTGCSQAAPFVAPTPAAAFDTTACPAALGGSRDVAPPAHHDGRLMDGQPAPSGALVCVYGSVFDQGPGPRHTLAKQVRLAAPAAEALAQATAEVVVGTSTGSVGCPDDTGDVTVIAFGYPHSPPLDLWWRTTGCQTIDNGAVEAEQIANDSFGGFQATFAEVARGDHQVGRVGASRVTRGADQSVLSTTIDARSHGWQVPK